MGITHDWDRVITIAKELAATARSWTDLATRLGPRVEGGRMPRQTLTQGIERELGRTFNSFQAFRDWALEGQEVLPPLTQALLDYLRRGERQDTPVSLVDLCERFDRGPSSIEQAVSELSEADYHIRVTDDRKVLMPAVIPPSQTRIPFGEWLRDRVHRFGVVSDTHLANRNSRLDVLECLYDWYAEEGIEVVLLAGNLVDGEFKYNQQELLAHGVEGQIAYAAENYPKREGIVTKFISADDHEGWWASRSGLDIGRHMHNTFRDLGREDLQWLGHVEVDLELHPDNPQAVLRMFHPGGGTAYAISYSPQKQIESWQGGNKPSVCIFGHYHKWGLFYPREVWCLLAGTTCDQTMFMRKKKLAAHVGGSILEIEMTSLGGVGEVKAQFKPFYDKGYYESNWDYLSMWV